MEWSAPAIVIDCLHFGEGDLRATVLTEEDGAWHGLARGGASRRGAPVWQVGNLIAARWVARLPEQLGSMTGELVHPAAALAMAQPLSLAILRAGCAVAAGTLPEREPHQAAFTGLARVLAGIAAPAAALPGLIRWEIDLLRELGYGLDLARCAVTGTTTDLAYVSPRTGRAVSLAAAGDWAPRLLPLPAFLAGEGDADGAVDFGQDMLGHDMLSQCEAGLALTGYFLEHAAFGARHAPLPAARRDLHQLVARMTEERRDAG